MRNLSLGIGVVLGLTALAANADAHTGRVYGVIAASKSARTYGVMTGQASASPGRVYGVLAGEATQVRLTGKLQTGPEPCSAQNAQTVDRRTLLAAPEAFRGKCVTLAGDAPQTGIVGKGGRLRQP